MHINHQAKGQHKHNFVLWQLNLCTSIIYAFVDVIAQGVLVRRKPQE